RDGFHANFEHDVHLAGDTRPRAAHRCAAPPPGSGREHTQPYGALPGWANARAKICYTGGRPASRTSCGGKFVTCRCRPASYKLPATLGWGAHSPPAVVRPRATSNSESSGTSIASSVKPKEPATTRSGISGSADSGVPGRPTITLTTQ